MADNFMSITNAYDLISKEVDNAGSSSTAADKIELRFDTTLSTEQVLKGIERFKRTLVQRKVTTNLPTDAS